jgi:hypothetical protein
VSERNRVAGVELLCCLIKNSEMDSHIHCTTQMYLKPPSHTFKMVRNARFYIMLTLSKLKTGENTAAPKKST